MSLLVIGTLAYDTVETVDDRRDAALGGSAVYFAVAASPFASPRLVVGGARQPAGGLGAHRRRSGAVRHGAVATGSKWRVMD